MAQLRHNSRKMRRKLCCIANSRHVIVYVLFFSFYCDVVIFLSFFSINVTIFLGGHNTVCHNVFFSTLGDIICIGDKTLLFFL